MESTKDCICKQNAPEKTSTGSLHGRQEVLLDDCRTMLAAVIVLLLVVLYRLWIRPEGDKDLQLSFTRALQEIGLNQSIGQMLTLAGDIRKNQLTFDKMLSTPTTRGSLGELSLETILSDQLPPDMFGIRKRVLNGKHPDAHIKSTVGTICIDSKFPLTDYRKMIETDDPAEKDSFSTQLLKDVEKHLQKVVDDYVCPEHDSADFAFVYIPSESVYWFLINEGYQLLRDWTSEGVQVVSPLTLAHKIELIKAGVHAKKLSDEAAKIQRDIQKLAGHFGRIDSTWETLYGTHLKRAYDRAEDLDTSWKKLRSEFRRIEILSDED